MEITPANLFYLFSMFVGSLVGLILMYYGFKKILHNILLGINFLLLTYISFIVWLLTTGYFLNFPFLYRTGNLAGFLFMPLMYIYIRTVLTEQGISWKDLVHFIPTLIILVDFLPVLMLSNDEKYLLIQSEVSDPVLFTTYTQSRFFPPNFYTPFRSIVLAFYWVISAALVWKNSKRKALKGFGKEWFVWIGIFLGLELLVFFPFLLLFWTIDPVTNFLLVHNTIVILTLITGFTLLFFPKILYGPVLDSHATQTKKKVAVPKEDHQENLSSAKIDEISHKLELVLDQKKHYLKHGYSVHELSEDTGFPVYILTIYINKVLGTTFPDLINQRRIEQCCEIIKSGKYAHLSVEGLAELCGFNNRNSFSLAFKKHKGMAPSAFYKAYSSRDKEAFS
jgi:AraC-like DNA-binding protein